MKKAFVVGASSAIGLAVCHRYLEEGWTVLAQYNRNEAALHDLAARADGRLATVRLAFDDPYALEAQLDACRADYIDSDALVNCAAKLEPRPFGELDAAIVLNHLAVNLLPGLLLMRDLGPAMAARGWGRIVHLGSIGTKFGGGHSSFAYALSKHALEMLPRECRAWSAHDVLVNVLRVGVTNTGIHQSDATKDMDERVALIPMKRMAEPAEIAAGVWFLGSGVNTFITGQVISISGGE